jgi:hypothetical protein
VVYISLPFSTKGKESRMCIIMWIIIRALVRGDVNVGRKRTWARGNALGERAPIGSSRGSVAGSGGRLGRLWGEKPGRVPAARLALQSGAEQSRAERSSSSRRNAPRGCLDDPPRLPRSAAGGGGAATTRATSTLLRPRRVCGKGAAWRSCCGS